MPTPFKPEPDKIRTIDQLLNSRWGRLAQDPEMRCKIPALLSRVLERLPSSHPVVNRIRLALQLFNQESRGGLVNSRNLLILSAGLLYTFWPADAIPDIVPLLGWLDDVGVLTLVLSTLAVAMNKEQQQAAEQSKEQGCPAEAKDGQDEQKNSGDA